jgi:hypothetical protein
LAARPSSDRIRAPLAELCQHTVPAGHRCRSGTVSTLVSVRTVEHFIEAHELQLLCRCDTRATSSWLSWAWCRRWLDVAAQVTPSPRRTAGRALVPAVRRRAALAPGARAGRKRGLVARRLALAAQQRGQVERAPAPAGPEPAVMTRAGSSLVAAPFAVRGNTASFRVAAALLLHVFKRHQVASVLPVPILVFAAAGSGARRRPLVANLTPACPHPHTVPTRLPSAASCRKVEPAISAAREM